MLNERVKQIRELEKFMPKKRRAEVRHFLLPGA
jgi:hypothetical protein